MALYRLSQRFRRRFRPKEGEQVRDKNSLEFKVLLLDDTDLTFHLHKKSKGQVLLDQVFKNLDLVEKDYFGLQFMDTHQVSHWLDPTKKIKKQVKIGPPYTLHFRVKFYAAEPHDLGEELTRYHFFLQIKQDIAKSKLEVPQKMAVDLVAFSLQSQLGDYEADLHGDDYMDEFRFYPNQNKELEKEIKKRHKTLVGLNPAECEVNFLRIVKKLDFYGINLHNVIGPNKMDCQLGLTPKGITVIKDNDKVAFFFWPRISKLTFKKKHFILEVQEDQKHADVYHYALPTAQAAKHLWKCAVEHHTFFRLIKPASKPKRTSSFLRFGSRFRYSGKTEYQAQKDSRLSARKSMKFKRASSERFTKRSTIGYIRVGSRVWGKALNGDFYKGVVTGLGQMIHIKFDNGDTIAHDRTDPECVVFDQDPDASEIQIGTRVIAHWPTLPAYLSGKVIGMEHQKYYVEYDDGDKHHNSINQMRILKPPIFFGPGSDVRKIKLKKKSESMKVTSLTGKAVITTELPARKSSDRSNGSLKASETDGGPALDTEELPSNEQRDSKLPSRSQSFPGNVRIQRGESGGDTSSENDLKQPRNKSFAGTTKVQKPPMNIFSLPETDVDSGITVAYESGKESRRNVKTFVLMNDDKAKKSSRSSSSASSRPEIVASRDAPYAPDFSEDNQEKQEAKYIYSGTLL
ncbi:uncharacterized protein LOC116303153 isoform X2 [Actinia tenebrosa]|uniref:Uncharacterized protein LOC116303153 isoform X2 n=1 Tax=Actinia tenebrosa TaxID=6105 RepID=A0A6P8IQC4_ACTTE|nr:uncharacterized protein LOC116303153 isoform X2 [Actinia tenebrosa]